jgi:hypothetical protein
LAESNNNYGKDDRANHLEAVMQIDPFVCDKCKKPVTDRQHRANQQVFRTERYLYCWTCWLNNNADDESDLLRVYEPQNIITEVVPIEIEVWSRNLEVDEEIT